MDERQKVEEMTVERDCSILSEDYKISYNYKGSKITVPPPMMRSWADSRLNLELLKAVEKAGYKTPSPIQMAAIPLGLQQQRDVIGIADTGSGKTAAFILPMLSYISKMKKSLSAATATAEEKGGPYALVLAPTRQLAEQIEEETRKFANSLGFKVVTIAGTGEEQIRFKISQGCEIVIATPFRLINCLDRCYVALNNCNYVVLYEPDRMITIGYECCMTRIFDVMPPSSRAADDEEFHDDDKKIIYRTTHMFSAIMTPVVEMLASKYLRNPVVVTVRKEATTDDFICKQNVIMMDFSPSEKFYNLQRLLGDLNDDQAIVFVDPLHEYFVANDLVRDGYRVTTLNMGDLEGFRTRRYNVLVVPGIVRHGVKYLPDVLHVINFDMPEDIETYTHRLRHFGRADRIGPASVVTTFLTLLDNGLFYDLKLVLYQSNSPVPPELASYNPVAPPVFKRHPL